MPQTLMRCLSFALVLTVGTTATIIEQLNAHSRHSFQGFHTFAKNLQAYASTRERLGLAVTFIASNTGDGYRREMVTVDLCAINPIRSDV